MYEPDEEPEEPGTADERPAYDWDAWEKNRMTGWTRWWMLLMLVSVVSMVALYFQSGGSMIPWGPPR